MKWDFGTQFFLCGSEQCWWPWESVLRGSSTLSEFHTSLSKVLTFWHCDKVKKRYLNGELYYYVVSTYVPASLKSVNSICYTCNKQEQFVIPKEPTSKKAFFCFFLLLFFYVFFLLQVLKISSPLSATSKSINVSDHKITTFGWPLDSTRQ